MTRPVLPHALVILGAATATVRSPHKVHKEESNVLQEFEVEHAQNDR